MQYQIGIFVIKKKLKPNGKQHSKSEHLAHSCNIIFGRFDLLRYRNCERRREMDISLSDNSCGSLIPSVLSMLSQGSKEG